MAEYMLLAPALLAGLLLGVFFFRGLFRTVTRGLASASPALWFLGSLVLRMGISMTGFYLVGGTDWRRWALCLVGFLIAREIVKSMPRAMTRHRNARSEEGGHAP